MLSSNTDSIESVALPTDNRCRCSSLTGCGQYQSWLADQEVQSKTWPERHPEKMLYTGGQFSLVSNSTTSAYNPVLLPLKPTNFH